MRLREIVVYRFVRDDDMNKGNECISKKEYCHMLSMMAIKNDSETIKELVPVISQPIVALGVLPYIALFCASVEDYCHYNGLEVQLQNKSDYKVSDVRNKLKLFSEKYAKTQKLVLTTDGIQDTSFRNKLRFGILAKLNWYYNLGVFFNSEGKMIGNTQYMFYMFQDKKFLNKNIYAEQVKLLGADLGTVVASVCEGLKNYLPEYKVKVSTKTFDIYFQDYNTNKDILFFPASKSNKDISLVILHLLCSINFLRYVLCEIVEPQNIWLLRIKYITIYYIYRSLEKLNGTQFLSGKFDYLLNENRNIINGDFRSCMMHYGFANKDIFSIKDEYMDYMCPFFGLIESCFDGAGYNELNRDLDKAMIMISDCLEGMILLDTSKREHI